MTAPVCFVDTETLGLDADHHPMWEVALITPDSEHLWHLPVTPRDLTLAHPKALEIGRFHERHGFDADLIQPAVFAREFADALPDGAHLAGAVVSFDEERLRRLFWRHGVAIPWHYHLIDVEAFAAGKLGLGPPWKSEELSRLVWVEPDRFYRHTALGDARWAEAIYKAVLA